MTNSAQENESRSSMIMSMERTLNSSWFARRQQTKDSYCSLSTGQYWDLLTYIDVSPIPYTKTTIHPQRVVSK